MTTTTATPSTSTTIRPAATVAAALDTALSALCSVFPDLTATDAVTLLATTGKAIADRPGADHLGVTKLREAVMGLVSAVERKPVVAVPTPVVTAITPAPAKSVPATVNVTAVPVQSHQCKANRKDGERCKGKPQTGTDYCHAHRDQATAKPAAKVTPAPTPAPKASTPTPAAKPAAPAKQPAAANAPTKQTVAPEAQVGMAVPVSKHSHLAKLATLDADTLAQLVAAYCK